jgi:hypothetical protein
MVSNVQFPNQQLLFFVRYEDDPSNGIGVTIQHNMTLHGDVPQYPTQGKEIFAVADLMGSAKFVSQLKTDFLNQVEIAINDKRNMQRHATVNPDKRSIQDGFRQAMVSKIQLSGKRLLFFVRYYDDPFHGIGVTIQPDLTLPRDVKLYPTYRNELIAIAGLLETVKFESQLKIDFINQMLLALEEERVMQQQLLMAQRQQQMLLAQKSRQATAQPSTRSILKKKANQNSGSRGKTQTPPNSAAPRKSPSAATQGKVKKRVHFTPPPMK